MIAARAQTTVWARAAIMWQSIAGALTIPQRSCMTKTELEEA